jgi:DNA-directed RNA polymerase subunit K
MYRFLICRYRLIGELGKGEGISRGMKLTGDDMTEYTRYEKARIIGARALQISRGAPLMIKTDLKDPIEIAEFEFEQNVIPIEVRRPVDAK